MALATSVATARQPVNRIPDDQPAVRHVFPPAKADQVLPGTEKFILFSREEIGGKDDWDFIAGAWEFIPSRPEAGVVKRAEFARSSWTATLAVKPSLGIEGPARNLVLHQVDDSTRPRGFRRNLLRADFRTWKVEFLGESPFVSVEGGNEKTLLVEGEDGYRHYRVATGQGEAGTAFTRIVPDRVTGFWLVDGKEDPNAGVWSYRPSNFEFVHPFPRPTDVLELPWAHLVMSAAREDGGAWAMMTIDPIISDPSPPVEPALTAIPPKPPSPDHFFQTCTIGGKLWFAETADAAWNSSPVEFRATPGSGIPWIVHDVTLWFEGGDLFFQAAGEGPEDERTIHQWHVAKGGEIRRSEAENLRRRPPDPESRTVPAEFRHLFRPDESLSGDPGLLAAAFLRSKGLVKDLPSYADRRVGVSADGRRFLWKTQGEPRPDLPPPSVLLYLDLDQGLVIEVPCPPELVRDNALEIGWVRCGKG